MRLTSQRPTGPEGSAPGENRECSGHVGKNSRVQISEDVWALAMTLTLTFSHIFKTALSSLGLQTVKSVLNHVFAVCLFVTQSGKPDLNTALPIRQTASIFKQPVTKVTGHPGNKVKSDLQRASEQPRQVRDISHDALRSRQSAFGLYCQFVAFLFKLCQK